MEQFTDLNKWEDQINRLQNTGYGHGLQPCPSCGHCPTCGRGGYFQPYNPWRTFPNVPYWENPTSTPPWTITSGDTSIV
jgi:hypothetical protein